MGTDKALLDVQGVPLLEWLIRRLPLPRSRILLSARDPLPYRRFRVRVVTDILPAAVPLAGIHAVLRAVGNDPVFLTACDLPYLHPDLIRHLLSHLGGSDAILPRSRRGIEPLCGIYRSSCLPSIENAARNGRFEIAAALSGARWKVLSVDESRWAVLGRSPFTNMNTLREYRQFLSDLGSPSQRADASSRI